MYKQSTLKCRFYAQGKCAYGNNCKFSHSGFRQLYIVRHAESIFNSLCEQLQPNSFSSQQAKLKFQLNPSIIDCGITQKGKQQAMGLNLPEDSYRLKRSSDIKVKFIDLVFVSPLNRALQTAEIILKNNKIRTKRIIILPQLTEVLSKVCDFSGSIQTKKSIYHKFDFSQFEILNSQLTKISLEKNNKNLSKFWQDQLLDEFHHLNLLHSQADGKRYMNILDSVFPTPLQSSERCFQRTLLALDKIKRISQKESAQKVLIISHNRILKYMCGRDNNGKASSLFNCELRKLVIDEEEH